MKIKNYTKLLAVAYGAVFLWMVSACQKDENGPAPVELDLPTSLTLNYGEEKKLDVSATLAAQGDVSLKVSFDGTPNVQITAKSKLYEQLSQAVTVNNDKDEVRINSNLLYPNGAVSVNDGTAIPDDYKITVIAQARNGAVVGEKTVSVKIVSGTIAVKGSENTGQYPFAYALHSKETTDFELESPTIPTAGTTWNLPAISGETVVRLEDNLIRFAGIEGNPTQQEEKSYDLEPALLKDGFPIASTRFKVIFIPQIKFFWGYYYPDQDISISFPIIHYSLTDGAKTQVPAFYPAEYKGKFEIVKIERLAPPYTGSFTQFNDTDGLFGMVEDTGEITVKKNTTLAPGHYRVTVKAISRIGMEFTTAFTLGMES